MAKITMIGWFCILFSSSMTHGDPTVEMKKMNKVKKEEMERKWWKKKRNLKPIVKKSYIEYQVKNLKIT